jgi:hypothetical protein
MANNRAIYEIYIDACIISYISAFLSMSRIHSEYHLVIREFTCAGPSPGRTAACENAKPGSEGAMTSNTKFLSGRGVVSIGIIFWNSTTDPGHPCKINNGRTLKFAVFDVTCGFTW